MIFPVKQPYNITTYFNKITHPGLDIAPIPAGTTGIQCYAPEAGIITASAFIANLEGNYVKMRGDSGMYYYFGHFSNRLVGVGARVSQGTVLGLLGKTGAATGIHVHHEVRTTDTGGQIDPMEYYKSVESEVPMPNEGDVHNAYLKANDRKATPDEIRVYTSKPWSAPDGLLYGKIFVDEVNFKEAANADYVPVGEQLYRRA